MRNALFLFAGLVLLSGCTPYRVTHNLRYGLGDRQTYDLYEPRVNLAGDPRPAILAIHGGGYVGGDKVWAKKVAERFCPWGYVVMGINYTLAPNGTWPRQLIDAKAALTHIRDQATRLRIRFPIAGLGTSAGAHLVAALHLQGDLPFAIGASGPWDMVNVTNPQLDAAMRALLGLAPGDALTPAQRALISPISWVHPGGDMLLIHAKRDPLTAYEHATRMEAALQGVGAKVKLVTVDSSSHGNVWNDATFTIRLWLQARQQ